jgi:pilus assembly protein Flp/PilA
VGISQIVAVVETPLVYLDHMKVSQIDKAREPSMIKLRNFLRDDNGATAIEYGLIAACISVAIIIAVQTVGTNLNNVFTNVSNALH